MTVPNNILQQVQTYQKAELAFLLNEFVAINISNKKFKDFNQLTGNLGDTVTFDLAPRATTQYGLVVNNFGESQQRVQSLTCSQAINTSQAFTDQQFIFNVEDYMDRFGMARIKELGSKIESDILRNITSSVRVLDPQSPNYGQILDPASGPYRFYGTADGMGGLQSINSVGQLSQALAQFRNYGAADFNTCFLLPDLAVPAIVNSSLGQFVMNRNEDWAEKWMVSMYDDADFYRSNLLPLHISGSVGNASSPNNILTLVSTNDPTGQNITQLTFSSPTTTAIGAIKSGDLMFIVDSNSYPTMRYLTFIGHETSGNQVQIRATSDADITSNSVTVNIYPALVSVPTLNQNLNNSLAAGMQFQVMPSHRAGLIISGNPLYLAMPQLPDLNPYNTVTTQDEDSGVSIRHYWGSQAFGQNTRGYIWDSIWGSTLVAENSMRVLFPANL